MGELSEAPPAEERRLVGAGRQRALQGLREERGDYRAVEAGDEEHEVEPKGWVP